MPGNSLAFTLFPSSSQSEDEAWQGYCAQLARVTLLMQSNKQAKDNDGRLMERTLAMR